VFVAVVSVACISSTVLQTYFMQTVAIVNTGKKIKQYLMTFKLSIVNAACYVHACASFDAYTQIASIMHNRVHYMRFIIVRSLCYTVAEIMTGVVFHMIPLSYCTNRTLLLSNMQHQTAPLRLCHFGHWQVLIC
jgi:hypothetical protein